MNIAAVIPSRYESTRFAGKPLAMIAGKPMIQHVYENTASCSILSSVVVATDNDAIADTVRSFGGDVIMTSSEHPSGTDRIAEAAHELDADIIVNVQGDEPLISSQAIEKAAQPLCDGTGVYMTTLKTMMREESERDDPNIVKVVSDRSDFALYFSRYPVPYVRSSNTAADIFIHIGLYSYTREFLFTLASLSQTPLERAESLEQLRVLEHGYRIKTVETDYYPVGVDVPADIQRVESMLSRNA